MPFALLASETALPLGDEPITSSDATALDPHWLEAAKHPQTGLLSRNIRPEEAGGYFAILNHARQLPLMQLKNAAKAFQQERLAVVRRDPNFRYYFREPDAEFPTFVDLHRNPVAYHGRLVTFRGHLRRLVSYPAGENPHGLKQLHEAWLYVDGAQQNPVVVVCSEVPQGITTGSDILVDFVSATGYFFKRYGYEDRAGEPRFAPLILAQRLEWSPPPKRTPVVSNGTLFGLTIAGGLLMLVLFGWQFRRAESADRKTRMQNSKQSVNSPRPSCVF
ncbi:MAG: hypothetical protein ACKV2Q_12440 [Planctomycetaceae bacterium]